MKSELALSIIFLILLGIFLNPFNLFMPPAFLSMMIVFLLTAFGFFILLIWKEQPKDEREKFHSMYADRLSLILGGTVLVVGIIFEELVLGRLDTWLIYALGAIVIGKLVGMYYIKKKN